MANQAQIRRGENGEGYPATLAGKENNGWAGYTSALIRRANQFTNDLTGGEKRETKKFSPDRAGEAKNKEDFGRTVKLQLTIRPHGKRKY